MSSDLLERYLQGEHKQVWEELRTHQSVNGSLLEEAHAVAIERMRRVARNIDRICSKLSEHEWRPLYGALRTPPLNSDEHVIRRLEELTGAPVPVSLRAFWEIVGGVNFVWNYSSNANVPALIGELEMDDMDPLCIYSAGMLEYLIEEFEAEGDRLQQSYRIALAPDYLHKINVSGGEPYGIDVPFDGVDPIFDDNRHALPFVDYLRLCLRWAGFPSLERIGQRQDLADFLQEWTGELEAF